MEQLDLGRILLPQTPFLEIVIRGTVMYLALFTLLRFIVKREAGSLAVTDLLVIVLIADAAQNGMADDYSSVVDGLLLVAVIVGWSYVLDLLAFRSRKWRRILRPAPMQLVRDGRILYDNLKREKITEDELLGEIRTHGCDDVRDVRSAHIESDGMISVITYGGDRSERPSDHREGIGA